MKSDIDKVTWSTTYYACIDTFEVWAEFTVGSDKRLQAFARGVASEQSQLLCANPAPLVDLLLDLRREVMDDLAMYAEGVVGSVE